MQSEDRYDIAILTVIPVEFRAIRQALKIDTTNNRKRVTGSIFFEATVYSRLLQRNLRVIVGCDVDASQAQASAMTTKIIENFDPAMIVLLGIGAGMRGLLKIGDVVIPRQIADLTTVVETNLGPSIRPNIVPWPHSVSQMMPGFDLDINKYHMRCRELFGPPIVPPAGKAEEYAKEVTFTPAPKDYAIGSADVLRKNAVEFARLRQHSDLIRAADMESAGFIKACALSANTRPWLVVRGISDFGDEFKDDRFHSLASCAAAAWLAFFLEDGFDPENLGRELSSTPPPAQSPSPKIGSLSDSQSLTTSVVEAQLELLSKPLSEDHLEKLDAIRDTWRNALSGGALEQVRLLKTRPDWRLIDRKVQAKILTFEASLVLAITNDVPAAKAIVETAKQTDSATNLETVNALITYHEFDARTALNALATPTTSEAWNLRLGLLTETEQWDTVLNETNTPPVGFTANAETHRLRAVSYLSKGNLTDAQAEIDRAIAVNPKWFQVRASSARIDYFHSLSTPAFLRVAKTWAEPVDPALIRRDAASVAALRKAEANLGALLAIPGLGRSIRRDLEGWRLGCLANDAERRNEAQKYCSILLEADPTHPVALAWGAARNYISDFGNSIDALYAELIPKK